MVISAILNCHNPSDRSRNEGASFYRLPSIRHHQGSQAFELSTVRQQAKIRRKNITQDRCCHIMVCSKHFLSGSPACLFDNLNPDWVPSVHLGHGNEGQSEQSNARFVRAASTNLKKKGKCGRRICQKKMKGWRNLKSCQKKPQFAMKSNQFWIYLVLKHKI